MVRAFFSTLRRFAPRHLSDENITNQDKKNHYSPVQTLANNQLKYKNFSKAHLLYSTEK